MQKIFIFKIDNYIQNSLDFLLSLVYNNQVLNKKEECIVAKALGTKQIAANRKAFHDYFIDDKYEAGISLVGTEVKSLRAGKSI